ncbi:hypothetical protein, conserved [Angomonas deanei]|uniref:RRM domain-containing protein n=1 Tax=Angomonas deanei TaxID=59799 RepID=A0A7G2C5Z8_9TRYP|nr:hypothetical protein, conserved [Angomonas deanei]
MSREEINQLYQRMNRHRTMPMTRRLRPPPNILLGTQAMPPPTYEESMRLKKEQGEAPEGRPRQEEKEEEEGPPQEGEYDQGADEELFDRMEPEQLVRVLLFGIDRTTTLAHLRTVLSGILAPFVEEERWRLRRPSGEDNQEEEKDAPSSAQSNLIVVEFVEEEEAQKALTALDGVEINGHRVEASM